MRPMPAGSRLGKIMAVSNEWTEWHLTPRGWEFGDEKTDFSP
jgi:hypothetical protein